MDSADATILWPPFTADSEKYLVLGLRMKIEQRLLPDRVAFWNDFIPKLSAADETVGKSVPTLEKDELWTRCPRTQLPKTDKRQSPGFAGGEGVILEHRAVKTSNAHINARSCPFYFFSISIYFTSTWHFLKSRRARSQLTESTWHLNLLATVKTLCVRTYWFKSLLVFSNPKT